MVECLAARQAIVVGGGYAGMAAAIRLQQAGYSVTVLEAAKQLGGRARGVELAGARLDNGQHLLLGAYTELAAYLALVHEPGTVPLMRLPLEWRDPAGFRLCLPPWPAPWHVAWGLLRAQGWQWRDKWAALRLVTYLRRQRFMPPDEQSVAKLWRCTGQTTRTITDLWHPLCLAALNTPPHLASSRVFAAVLRDSLLGARTASDAWLAQVDLGALFPEPAARWLQERGGWVHCRQRVLRLLPQVYGGWQVETSQKVWSAAVVVLAVAPQHVAALLPSLPALSEWRECLERFCFEPIATVYFQCPATVRLPHPFYALSDGWGQWVFDRGHSLPHQAGWLAVVISSSGGWQSLDKTSLCAAVWAQLRTHWDLPPYRFAQLIVEKRATFAAYTNLIRPTVETGVEGLWVVGDYVAGEYPATLEGAVRSVRALPL